MAPTLSSRTLSRVALLTYAVAAIVLLFVVTDLMAVSRPLSPGELSWRYGVIGLTGGTLYHPLVALFLGSVAAALADHRAMLGVFAGLSLLAVLALLGMLAVFSLDAAELRTLIREGSRAGRFDRASFQVFLKLAVGSIGFACIAFFAFKQLASRGRSRDRSEPRDEGPLRRPPTP